MPETSYYSGKSLLQPRERLARGLLLGGLLRPALAATELLVVDERGTREAALVRRPLDRDLGVVHPAAPAREQLLQVRLVVDAGRERMLDLIRERVDDRLLDCGEAVLQEERAERRLDYRGEDVAVLAPAARAPRPSASEAAHSTSRPPRPSSRATSAQVARETTWERTFASCPSEKSGWRA